MAPFRSAQNDQGFIYYEKLHLRILLRPVLLDALDLKHRSFLLLCILAPACRDGESKLRELSCWACWKLYSYPNQGLPLNMLATSKAAERFCFISTVQGLGNTVFASTVWHIQNSSKTVQAHPLSNSNSALEYRTAAAVRVGVNDTGTPGVKAPLKGLGPLCCPPQGRVRDSKYSLWRASPAFISKQAGHVSTA